MAERLTEYFECGAYTKKQNIIDVSDKVKFFDNGCVMGKAIDKLARVEDILEKYDIESVEELETKLEITNESIKKAQQKLAEIYIQDRDTWKRACELACEREDDCYVYDNIHRAFEFYQQAKTEGNDE